MKLRERGRFQIIFMLFYTNVCEYTCMHMCPGGYRRIHTCICIIVLCWNVSACAYGYICIYVQAFKHMYNITTLMCHVCSCSCIRRLIYDGDMAWQRFLHTGPLWRKSIDYQWIPLIICRQCRPFIFSLVWDWTTRWKNSRVVGDKRTM